MALSPLNYWMLHNDPLAQQFDAILKFSPGYNPIRLSGLQGSAQLLENFRSESGAPLAPDLLVG